MPTTPGPASAPPEPVATTAGPPGATSAAAPAAVRQVQGGSGHAPGTTLLLVRHGATAHTAQGRFSGCTGQNPPLSPLGERQAAALARRLAASGGITAVYASPVLRARQTGQLLAGALGLPLAVDDELREVDFGQWEGRTGAQVQRDWPSQWALWRGDAAVAPPGGESVAAVARRVARARGRLTTAHPGGTLVLVSHLYPVRLSVLDALGAPYAAVHRMVLQPTAVSEVRAGGPGELLVRYNDAGHLDGTAAG